MLTLEEYHSLYESNLRYYTEHKTDQYSSILDAIGDKKFFVCPSRHDKNFWLLEINTDSEPSPNLPIVISSQYFIDYHISESDARCLMIESNPFITRMLERTEFDGEIPQI